MHIIGVCAHMCVCNVEYLKFDNRMKPLNKTGGSRGILLFSYRYYIIQNNVTTLKKNNFFFIYLDIPLK